MKTATFHASVVAAMAIALLASCGKSPEAAKPAAPEAPKAAGVSETKLDAAIADALNAPAPVPASASDLENEAKAILAKYPGKTAQDLLNVPEVNQKLRNALAKLSQDKPLLARINSSVDLAAQIKGLEGSAKLDLDMTKYDQARTTRMLQAVISEDPKQIVSFLVGEIGEAAPDISFGGLDRAPNGVSIVPNPAAAPAKPDLPD
ncbi:hypothetical protein [Prosthecobacter sp.]|uniref:hypothetical protein n=1 Tax=Prosthecobacter sp. TaxID=1965333 RepID=UPI002ABA5496|nr:hypothetical protein [Prosthecobacter sp.]MDZ4402326.1 hypothetical protein [Prosthecobacter sp.]